MRSYEQMMVARSPSGVAPSRPCVSAVSPPTAGHVRSAVTAALATAKILLLDHVSNGCVWFGPPK